MHLVGNVTIPWIDCCDKFGQVLFASDKLLKNQESNDAKTDSSNDAMSKELNLNKYWYQLSKHNVQKLQFVIVLPRLSHMHISESPRTQWCSTSSSTDEVNTSTCGLNPYSAACYLRWMLINQQILEIWLKISLIMTLGKSLYSPIRIFSTSLFFDDMRSPNRTADGPLWLYRSTAVRQHAFAQCRSLHSVIVMPMMSLYI